MSVTDEIKARLDIIEVVQGYVPLKKAGRNFNALCPFHSEKTPSFVVFPDTQTWRCFGCGQGGDIFTFVQKIENLDFTEALRFLAQQAGVELQSRAPQEAEDKETYERLRRLLSDAATFFYNQLLRAPYADHVRDYVEQRGLSTETVEAFQLGYAPDSWDATEQALLTQGYEHQDLIDAGLLVVHEETDRAYDRFRDRLMIPIRDTRGQVVGFGARALRAEAKPKYLNTPQSTLFDKSRLLFGLSHARRAIRDSNAAVIVEGYMDVMQAHQAGFANVVAQMGTALTEPQLRLLTRYATRLVLALDPDTAGQMATHRSQEVALRVSTEEAKATEVETFGKGVVGETTREHLVNVSQEFDPRGMLHHEARLGFELYVITLPEGRDPDALIRESPQAWADLVAQALPIVEYAIQTAIAGEDLNDPKTKARIAEQIIPLIDSIANAVERSHYRQRLARLLQVDERSLFVSPITGRRRRSRREAPPPATPIILSASPAEASALEAFCLAALILNPNLLRTANRALAEALDNDGKRPDTNWLAPKLTEDDFASPEHRSIYRAWLGALAQDENEPLEYLTHVLDELLGERLQIVLQAYDADTPPVEGKALTTALQRILDLRVQRLHEYVYEAELWLETADLTTDEQHDTIKAHIAGRQALQRARLRLGMPGEYLNGGE